MCPIRYRALVQVFGMKSSVSKSPDWCRTWKSHAVTRTTKSDYRTYGFGTIPVVRLTRQFWGTNQRNNHGPYGRLFTSSRASASMRAFSAAIAASPSNTLCQCLYAKYGYFFAPQIASAYIPTIDPSVTRVPARVG